MSSQNYEPGLEPTPQDFPEVSHAQRVYRLQTYNYHRPSASGTPPSPSSSSPHDQHLAPKSKEGRTICGCPLLVFVLSCIMGMLSAAMIGLAVSTGIESQRASKAESNVAALKASVTEAGTHAVIDGGCALDPAKVDGTPYTSFSLFGASNFIRYCNKDTPHAPLISLFTADFDTCMDACAAYTQYVFDSADDDPNSSCHAVSFIPSWTNKTAATVAKAPGNCYLKGGPQRKTALKTPTLVCHAALLAPGEG